MKKIVLIFLIICNTYVPAQNTDSINIKERKLLLLSGIGAGGYLNHIKKFANTIAGGVLYTDMIYKNTFSLSFKYVFTPFTKFGTLRDGYLSFGICFKVKLKNENKILITLYDSFNLIGKSSKDSVITLKDPITMETKKIYFRYSNNTVSLLLPGLRILFNEKKKKIVYGMDFHYFKTIFTSSEWDYPYRYADRYPPFYNHNFFINIFVCYKIIK